MRGDRQVPRACASGRCLEAGDATLEQGPLTQPHSHALSFTWPFVSIWWGRRDPWSVALGVVPANTAADSE